MVVLDPKGAALAAAKMLALSDPSLHARVVAYQAAMTEAVVKADRDMH